MIKRNNSSDGRLARAAAQTDMADLATRPAFTYKILLAIALACCMFFVSGCASSRGGSIPYSVQDFNQPDQPSALAIEEEYRIAPLDKVSVEVFQVKELSGTYQVDLTGRITLPLIGGIRAIDLTVIELETLVREKLAERYLKNPRVAVGILDAGGSKITVEGSVKQPGLYAVYGRTSLLQAIAMAKGVDEMGNAKRVAIFRQVKGERVAAAFDLTTIRQGKEPDPQVYRGDIIVVEGSKTRQAWMDAIRSLPVLSVFTPFAY